MSSVRSLSGLLAGFVLAISLGSPAEARTTQRTPVRANYDGNWSVLIVTNSGPCDRGYRYGLSIRGGRVFYEGSLAVNVDGQVAPNGAVRVRVSAGSQGASGIGRLSSDGYGEGSWRGEGSAGNCWGTWTAERRAPY
ncbi:MAG: hypothetical protein WDO17_19535 [Alphaproteobacteria bacterium]